MIHWLFRNLTKSQTCYSVFQYLAVPYICRHVIVFTCRFVPGLCGVQEVHGRLVLWRQVLSIRESRPWPFKGLGLSRRGLGSSELTRPQALFLHCCQSRCRDWLAGLCLLVSRLFQSSEPVDIMRITQSATTLWRLGLCKVGRCLTFTI